MPGFSVLLVLVRFSKAVVFCCKFYYRQYTLLREFLRHFSVSSQSIGSVLLLLLVVVVVVVVVVVTFFQGTVFKIIYPKPAFLKLFSSGDHFY
jgi:hypothetical protein